MHASSLALHIKNNELGSSFSKSHSCGFLISLSILAADCSGCWEHMQGNPLCLWNSSEPPASPAIPYLFPVRLFRGWLQNGCPLSKMTEPGWTPASWRARERMKAVNVFSQNSQMPSPKAWDRNGRHRAPVYKSTAGKREGVHNLTMSCQVLWESSPGSLTGRADKNCKCFEPQGKLL